MLRFYLCHRQLIRLLTQPLRFLHVYVLRKLATSFRIPSDLFRLYLSRS
jgi:hypothetical protein